MSRVTLLSKPNPVRMSDGSGKVGSNKAILELVKGRELKNETTYVIKGKVSAGAGNSLDLGVDLCHQAQRVSASTRCVRKASGQEIATPRTTYIFNVLSQEWSLE